MGVSSSVAILGLNGSRKLIRDFLTIRLDELNKKLVQCARSAGWFVAIGPAAGKIECDLPPTKLFLPTKEIAIL